MAPHAVPPTRKPASATAWKARADAGPHTATLPSGTVVRFTVPDSNMLIASNRLPGDLMEIALYAASYPDGAAGYMSDMAVRSSMRDESPEKLHAAVRDGIRLGHWLVAEMLVEPQIAVEEVPELPPMDVRMLLELAERRRNTDAEGVVLPIAMLEEYAQFQHEPGRPAGNGNGAGVDPGVPPADGGADEG